MQIFETGLRLGNTTPMHSLREQNQKQRKARAFTESPPPEGMLEKKSKKNPADVGGKASKSEKMKTIAVAQKWISEQEQ